MWPNKADPTGNAFMVIAYAWQACSVTNFQGVDRFDAGKTTVHWSRVGRHVRARKRNPGVAALDPGYGKSRAATLRG